MAHHMLIDKLNHNFFERWTRSDIAMKKLAEVVCTHPNLTERVLEITNFKETKENLVENGNIIESQTQSNFSLMASKDDSKTSREHMRLQSRKILQRNFEMTKTPPSSTSLNNQKLT